MSDRWGGLVVCGWNGMFRLSLKLQPYTFRAYIHQAANLPCSDKDMPAECAELTNSRCLSGSNSIELWEINFT
eukprot:5800842-Amphidinium_carterae.1